MDNPPHDGLVLHLWDLVGLLGFVTGFHLLLLGKVIAGIVALVFSLLIAFHERWLTALNDRLRDIAFHARQRRSHYLAWMSSETADLFQSYPLLSGDDRPVISLDQAQEISGLTHQLTLQLPELHFIAAIAKLSGTDVTSILHAAVTNDTVSVHIDGRTFYPTTGFGRVLIALANDSRYGGLPVQKWIIESKQWILAPASPPPDGSDGPK